MIGYEDIVWSSQGLELSGVSYTALSFPRQHNHFALYNNTATATIAGIDRDSVLGRPLWLTNRGSENIRFLHDNATADADKRLSCPGGFDYTLLPGESCLALYNSNDDRTEIIGVPAYTASVGGTFPDSPYDGFEYYRTDLLEEFRWSETHSAWIGQNSHTHNFGDRGSLSGSRHLEGAGTSAFGGGDRGYRHGVHDWAVVNMGGAWGGAGISGSLQLRVGNSTIKTISFSAANEAEEYDFFEPFTAGVVQAYINTNSGTYTHPSAWADIRRVFEVESEQQGN